MDASTAAFERVARVARECGIDESLLPSLRRAFNEAADQYEEALASRRLREIAREPGSGLDWRKIKKIRTMFSSWLRQWNGADGNAREELTFLMEVLLEHPQRTPVSSNEATGLDTLEREITLWIKGCDEHLSMFKSQRGQQSKNRSTTDGPPIAPLYKVRDVLHSWWNEKMQAKWQPKFVSVRRDEDVPLKADNPEAKLYFAFAKAIDDRYLPENCYSTVDTRVGRKVPRKRSSKAK